MLIIAYTKVMAEKAKISLGISNLDLHPRDIALAGPERLRDILHQIDPDGTRLPAGYQITPTRVFMRAARRNIRTVSPKDANTLLFSSTHQSWGSGLRRGLLSGSKVGLFGSMALVEQHRSVAELAELTRQTGGRAPAVVYAGHKHNGRLVNFGAYGFPQTSAQIMPEVTGVQESLTGDPRRLRESLLAQRIDGLTVGSHHLTRAYRGNPNYRLDADRMLDIVSETEVPVLGLHPEFGRTDTSNEADHRQTMQERDAVLKGPEAIGRTAMGWVLERSYGIWREQTTDHPEVPPLEATMEVTYAGLMADSSNPADFIPRMRDAADHMNAFFDGVEQRLAG